MDRSPRTQGSDTWSDDTASFNRWLCVSRIRAAIAVGVFFPLLWALGLVHLHVVPVLLTTAGLAAFSLVAFRTPRLTERSQLFFWLQLVVDMAGITAGIGFATHGSVALIARPIYVAAIVPASLVSVPCGLAAATLASLGHALLLLVEQGPSLATFTSFAFLAPIFLFFLVAQQSFVYGAHLREKNATLAALAQRLELSQRRLAEEGRLAAGTAEIARALSDALDDPEPLTRVVCTIRDRLWADWCAMLAVDGSSFRLLAVSDPEVAATHVDRIDFPLATWPALARLPHERTFALRARDVATIPTSLSGQALGTALLAALYRDREMVGFLAVGYRTPLDHAEAWATHLLAGLAEHASVVLHNARLLDEVRAASALKSEFVGAVSHELRSPLNIILGYLEMVLDEALGPLTAEQRDALLRTEVHAATLLEMIDALLDLNRLDAGRLPVERSEVSPGAVLDEVCAQAGRSAGPSAVELRRSIAPDVPSIVTDSVKLKTIVRNLVQNAVKFTERGHVAVAARRHGDGVEITVEDTGCGIPPEALGYVFEMFRQVPGSGGGGVGLGLHIVRRLAEAIGATVSVTSEVGRGTRFVVLVPSGRSRDEGVAPHADTRAA
jgi:signal transduction histidine kinase